MPCPGPGVRAAVPAVRDGAGGAVRQPAGPAHPGARLKHGGGRRGELRDLAQTRGAGVSGEAVSAITPYGKIYVMLKSKACER